MQLSGFIANRWRFTPYNTKTNPKSFILRLVALIWIFAEVNYHDENVSTEVGWVRQRKESIPWGTGNPYKSKGADTQDERSSPTATLNIPLCSVNRKVPELRRNETQQAGREALISNSQSENKRASIQQAHS